MTRYFITEDQITILTDPFSPPETTQQLLKTIRTAQELGADKPLPKQHRDAVGLSYYEAMGATEPWAIVNNTGTLLTLLSVSVEDAGDKTEKRAIERQMIQWRDASRAYGTPNNDSEKFHAAWLCQRILQELGRMPYRYGNIPSAGFKLTTSGGNK